MTYSNVEERKKSDMIIERQKLQFKNGSEEESGGNNNNVKAENEFIQDWLSSSPSPMMKSQSYRIASSTHDHDEGKLNLRAESCRSLDVGTLSMRRAREWERTLACKLLEERKNVGGLEGMDSLWEAYEMEEVSKEGKKKKKREKSVEREWEEEDDEEEDEEIKGQVCCLQALKMSTGKRILGVGKPNLVKISKAIKGFGWLHKTSKNSKKVHNVNHGDHR